MRVVALLLSLSACFSLSSACFSYPRVALRTLPRLEKFGGTARARCLRGGASGMNAVRTVTWDDTPIAGPGEKYTVPNLLFVGMNGGGLGPTVVGLAALGAKLTLAAALVSTFFISAVPLTDYTWTAISGLAWGPRFGMYAALFVAPAFVLTNMFTTTEFKDQAVFFATLHSRRAAMSPLTYWFWVLVHALRGYVQLPLFVLANAAVMCTAPSFEKVLGNAFYAMIVLSLDDCFKVMYERVTGKTLSATVQLGEETKCICDGVVNNTVRVLAVAQLALCFALKIAALSTDARLAMSLPVMSAALGWTYLSRSKNYGHATIIVGTALAMMGILK